MKNLSKKTAYIDDFNKKISDAKVLIVANYEGVNVEQMTALRKSIRQLGDEIKVVKNTLLSRALKEHKKDALTPFLTGATAIIFGYKDPVAPVKALFDFAEKASKFKFKSGMLGDQILTVKQLEQLSKLPSRNQLLSMMMSAMQGTIRNAVSVIQGPIRKFVYALNAVKEKKEKQG